MMNLHAPLLLGDDTSNIPKSDIYIQFNKESIK